MDTGHPRHVGQVVAIWDGWAVDVVVGQRSHRFNGGDWVGAPGWTKRPLRPFAMVNRQGGRRCHRR